MCRHKNGQNYMLLLLGQIGSKIMHCDCEMRQNKSDKMLTFSLFISYFLRDLISGAFGIFIFNVSQ